MFEAKSRNVLPGYLERVRGVIPRQVSKTVHPTPPKFENFCEVIFWGDKYVKNIFSKFGRGRVDSFAHLTWNYSAKKYKKSQNYCWDLKID